MRTRARKDANHTAIITALRAIGASVLDLASVGDGCPDLCAGFRGRNWLLEVKDGDKAPSRRELTPAQIKFKTSWRGQWAVVSSVAEAIEVVTRQAAQS